MAHVGEEGAFCTAVFFGEQPLRLNQLFSFFDNGKDAEYQQERAEQQTAEYQDVFSDGFGKAVEAIVQIPICLCDAVVMGFQSRLSGKLL